MKIAVLIACYNRAPVTLAGIGALKAGLASVEGVEPAFFVVDDASPDQTFQQVQEAFPDVVIAQGTGALFWVGGMRRAYELAREKGRFDAYLMFNDDVAVDGAALGRFFAEYRHANERGPAILAAATKSAADGRITYSAMRRTSRWRPLAVERIIPDGTVQSCDTFNGNFVLVPGPFFETAGGLDGSFVHAYADIDLGYVAEAEGIPRYLASVAIGTCETAEVDSLPAGVLATLFTQELKKDSLRQRAYFIFKHTPFPVAVPMIAGVAVRRMLRSVAAALTRQGSPAHKL